MPRERIRRQCGCNCAEIARRRKDPATEETQLGLAAESGQAEEAWTRLAELLRERGDRPRLAATLRLLAQKKSGSARAALLREAQPLLPPDEAALLEEEILEADPRDTDAQRRVFERLRLSAPAKLVEWVARLRKEGVEPLLDGAVQRAVLKAERRYADVLSLLDAAAHAAQADPAERDPLGAGERSSCSSASWRVPARRRAGCNASSIARRTTAQFWRARASSTLPPPPSPSTRSRSWRRSWRWWTATRRRSSRSARGELLLSAGADAEGRGRNFCTRSSPTPRVAALLRRAGRGGTSGAAIVAGALEHLISRRPTRPDLEPPRAGRACAVDAADVLLKEGDNASAERLYQLAAALDPADRRAVDGLIRLAAARGDHERQADLLARAAALTADRRERARLALHRARLFQTELRRDLEAYRAYKEAVACDPTLREARRTGLRALAESRAASGRWRPS